MTKAFNVNTYLTNAQKKLTNDNAYQVLDNVMKKLHRTRYSTNADLSIYNSGLIDINKLSPEDIKYMDIDYIGDTKLDLMRAKGNYITRDALEDVDWSLADEAINQIKFEIKNDA